MTTEKMDLGRVIDKVRKLLALGTSPNEHEAASAVAKAHSLLAEYDLSIESIGDLKADPRTSIRRADPIVSATDGKPEGWRFDLFAAVAQDFDCFTANSWTYETTKGGKQRSVKHGNLIGFGHDVEAAGYALSFLIGEIERLAQTYADGLWAEIRAYRDANSLTQHDAESQYTARTGRHPLKAKLYFIKGAAESVVDKLNADWWDRKSAARRAESDPTNPYAVVLHKKAAIDDFICQERYGMTKVAYDAKIEAEAAEWRAKRGVITYKEAPKVETEAQRMKREAKEERESNRYHDARARERERAEAKVDRRAFGAGSEAGSKISIRPGIGAGKTTGEIS